VDPGTGDVPGGGFWQLEDASMEPRPFRKPYPPLWFGGAGPAALRRAVREGDGFFGAGSSPAAKFAEQVQAVFRALQESGRSVADFQVAKRVYVAIDEKAERARSRTNEALERLYGQRAESIEAAAVAGTPAGCLRQLREVAAAGAELILFTPLLDQAGHAERLAAEVIPQLAQD
jgi:alkanesulfonate monooxygenase SsuD/methylene tetrahydromethanopterin reductase-like flavin-dependent oxidoreductase (luciferase family)